jgi:protoheme IX farnesyltransferase
VAALAGGALMVMFAWRVWNQRQGEGTDRAAHHLFAFSILYLFILFAVLLIDARLVG